MKALAGLAMAFWPRVMRPLASAVALSLLAACGGGADGEQADISASGASKALRGALALTTRESKSGEVSIEPTELLDWAEQNYRDLFPSHEADQSLAPYIYRYYPATRTYVGVDTRTPARTDDRMIVLMGPSTSDAVVAVGRLQDYACLVRLDKCVAPTISRQLQSVSVTPGTSVTFSVDVSGGPSLQYRWLVDGMPMQPEYTQPTLSVVADASTNGHTLSVVVSNARGAVRSAEAGITLVAQATPARELAKLHNCMACHAVANKLIGPSFQSIAGKYAGTADALPALVKKVRSGSVGVWGAVPMPATAGASDHDLETIVGWILAGAP